MEPHFTWYDQLPFWAKAQEWLKEQIGVTFLAKQAPQLYFVVGALLVFVAALIVVFLARRAWRNPERALVPDAKLNARNFLELLVQGVLGLMRDVMGDKAKEFLPFIGTLAVFIFFSNVLGLIPGFLPPTQNLNVTLACGSMVFLFYHGYGIRENWRHLLHGAHHASAGKKYVLFPLLAFLNYFSHFANPIGIWWGWFLSPLLLPIELISHVARPLSLSLRLMGNITGDHTVVGVFLGIVAVLLPLPVMLLGVLVAVIQTLVFCLLSTVYISMAVADEEH